ncbi:MAG TPA: carboxypeptidase-like regulatory domain-containing protein [Gemmatimonadales bacterium]|nr:carboxypeptidase-like regulatory domain-containing protein [Gemmatimonadales bacterium]
MRRFAVLLSLSTLLFAGAARAQVIRGRLSSELEGPTAGAIVELLDAGGAELGRTLSAASGRYGFVAPAAGSYRLKVLRIGYPVWVSDTVSVGAAEVREFSPQLPARRVVLASIEVHARNQCSVHPKEGELTAQLLEEGRKAVSAAEAAYQGHDYRYRVRRYRRDFDRDLVVVLDTTFAETENDIWPVQSLPVADLERGGFIQDTDPFGAPTWYGPDAQVIFSDFFLGDHCFAIGKPEPSDSGLVRLEFRVVKGHELPDLNGTLWIDPKTLDLDHLDFTYTRRPDWVPRDAVVGGRLDFLRLPTGLWIIRRWALRVPIPARQEGTGYYSVSGYQEEGGSVVRVTGKDGEVVFGG